MEFMDVLLPHRLIINHSLRKASDQLRDHIDRYQDEYKETIKCYTAEIEKAKAVKDEEFETAKNLLVQELLKDQSFFNAISTDLLDYFDLHYQKECLSKIISLKQTALDSINDNISFLSNQMKLIGEEIDLLETRKNILVSQASIDDIKQLIALSETNIDISSSDDAMSIVEKLDALIASLDITDRINKYALQKLKSVLHERIQYLSEIQYITWVIEQKKQLSRQCSFDRRSTYEEKNICWQEYKQMLSSLRDINSKLFVQAKKVRDNWDVPIQQLSDNISKAEDESEIKEYRQIKKRLSVIYRNEDYREQETLYKKNAEKIAKQISDTQNQYTSRINTAEQELTRKQNDISRATLNLTASEKQDKRFFIAKLFSDTPEVTQAKKKLQTAQSQAKAASDSLTKLQSDMENEIRTLDREMNKGRPVAYKPTDQEFEEIKPLMQKKRELESKHDYQAIDKQLNEWYTQRKRWTERRGMIYSLCKKNNVYLLSEKKQGANDGVSN